jgi:hypothetical protein
MLISIRQMDKQHNKMENNHGQQSKDHQRESWTRNARKLRQNMSIKQRQQDFFVLKNIDKKNCKAIKLQSDEEQR